MSEYADVVATRGIFRAVIVPDDYPTAPDYDGEAYVFQVEPYGRRASVETAWAASGYGVAAPALDWSDALERFGLDWMKLERYARIFGDVVSFDYITPERGRSYFAIVTREMAQAWGIDPDGEAARESAANTLTIWGHYVAGECYTAHVEMLEDWSDPDADEWTTVDDSPTAGYYGRTDAEMAALELLGEYGAPDGRDVTPERMREILQAYAVCALWSSPNQDDVTGEPTGNLDDRFDVDDIAPATLAKMRDDVVAFVVGAPPAVDTLEASQVGHDFWLTRHHHGAGFWDRGLGKLGDELTAWAQTFGDFNLYVETTRRIITD